MSEIEQATPDPRAELVAGLRLLADFYEQHPEVDLPYGQQWSHSIPNTEPDWAVKMQQLAAALGVSPSPERDGHINIDARFRGVKFHGYHIRPDRMKRHVQEQSYTGNVQVDEPTVVDGHVVEPTRALPATSSTANTAALLGVTR